MTKVIALLCTIAMFWVCDLSAQNGAASLMQHVNAQKMKFSLPPLPYAYDALEPYLDARTMDIHYNRHHAAYINNLNKAVDGTEWQNKTLLELFAQASKLPSNICNNAGGHWNHSFFWSNLRPAKDNPGMGKKMRVEIEKYFGSIDSFKAEFKRAGLERFGSGWAWLIRDKNNNLAITSTNNQENPLMDIAEIQGTPLLTCDVWEHAYYLKYLNRRDEFLDAFWNVINWQNIETLAFPAS